ncbi:trypsin-like [Protopterus annectens]|uniref:trypsin-like n=1 Tax=Protopterus annectens TaxID=7888 RepID=UPI001CFB477C|nr:trypsin-like [Protopterus annectens]
MTSAHQGSQSEWSSPRVSSKCGLGCKRYVGRSGIVSEDESDESRPLRELREPRELPSPPFIWTRKLNICLLFLISLHLVADDRIIGGYECIPHSLPWQVSLYSNTGGHVCGGSLLSANWVISAAHCSLPSLQIRIGKHNIETVEEGEQNIRAAKQIIHPNYDKWGLENDLMMIKLASPAVLSESAQPIALPSTCVSVGTECLVSGWGTTISPGESYPPLLQCLNITILEDSNCDAAYPGEYTDNMLCAGFVEAGKDSCKVWNISRYSNYMEEI